jgi:hypothetical protein
MIDRIPPAPGTNPFELRRANIAAQATSTSTSPFGKVLEAVGERSSEPTPPADALRMLDHAQGVLAQLREKGLDLRYDVDMKSRQVKAQLVDGAGKVVRELPATKALELLAGKSTVDELA